MRIPHARIPSPPSGECQIAGSAIRARSVARREALAEQILFCEWRRE